MLELHMENYRRFVNPKPISFKSGLTVVSGPNGAGKTTLVECLIFALYGKLENITKSDLRSDDSRTNETKVTCCMQIEGNEVEIVRWEDRVRISINGMVQIEEKPNNITVAGQEIIKLLGGLTQNQFENTYIARQGDTAGLILDKHPARCKLIEEILQVDVLKKAAENQKKNSDKKHDEVVAFARLIIRELQFDSRATDTVKKYEGAQKIKQRTDHIQDFKMLLQEAKVAYKQQLAEAEKNVIKTEADLDAKREDCDNQERQISKFKDVLVNYEAISKDYLNFQKDINIEYGGLATTKRDLLEVEGEISSAEPYAAEAKQYSEYQQQITELQQRKSEFGLLKERYNNLQGALKILAEYDKNLDSLSNADKSYQTALAYEKRAIEICKSLENDPTSQAFNQLSEREGTLKEQFSQAQLALKTIRDNAGKARCPSCNQPLDEHQRLARQVHLTNWINQDFQHTKTALISERKAEEAKHNGWLEERNRANIQQDQLRRKSFEAKQLLDKRNTLIEQRSKQAALVIAAQQAFDELSQGNPYDPDSEINLQMNINQLITNSSALKDLAIAFGKLPSLQTRKNILESRRDGHNKIIIDLQNKQTLLCYDENAHEQAKINYQQALITKTELVEKRSSAEIEVTNQNFKYQQASELVRKTEDYQGNFETKVKEAQREHLLWDMMRNFAESYLKANSVSFIQRATQLLLAAVTDQSILGLEFNEKGLYYRDITNIQRPIERLSGGEKALVGLCLRIALAEQAQYVISKGRLCFLFLDEVLASLDDQRREAVQQILAEVQRSGIFSHIILITHLDAVKDGWRATSLVVRKIPNTRASEIVE